MYGLLRSGISATTRREAVRSFQSACALRSVQPSGEDILKYKFNPNETTNIKKARLLYQSRKRGMLENDLLLSTFIDKYLMDMNEELLEEYDKLINSVYSDWDIYYWLVEKEPTPPEFDNKLMALLKEHVKNKSRERRIRQPDLPAKVIQK